jgi:hypothetical protein
MSRYCPSRRYSQKIRRSSPNWRPSCRQSCHRSNRPNLFRSSARNYRGSTPNCYVRNCSTTHLMRSPGLIQNPHSHWSDYPCFLRIRKDPSLKPNFRDPDSRQKSGYSLNQQKRHRSLTMA